MLSGETIIYFGPEPWDGLWRNRHQLMSRFAAENDVWYVEPPANLRRLFSRGTRRRTRLFSTDASGVRIFHSPWWLPTTGRDPFKRLSIRLYLGALALAARIGRSRPPIVWLSRPSMVELIGKLHEKLTIYHVVDEYSGYGDPSEETRKKLERREEEMLRSADIVIVVTPTLFDLKSPHNRNTYLVQNAVNFDSYSDCDSQTPDDMLGIQSPVIGYSGLIAARLDLDLLQTAAESRPDWNFVFVGTVNDENCEAQLRKLRALSNVHLLEQKPVDDVPQYVHQFDVCIVPYALNLRAQHAGPLKLYEYAAASRPIVATDFAAARAFAGHVSLAGDASQFIEACERSLALTESSPDILENRRLAADNTWEHRIQQISDILASTDV